VLAVGLKELKHTALEVRRVVHQLEQRQIVQLGTAVKVALRKKIAVLHHNVLWTSGLNNPLTSWTSRTSC
jgi:hypothetical protein